MEKFFEIMQPLPVGQANEHFCKCSYCNNPAQVMPAIDWRTESIFYAISGTCGSPECEKRSEQDFDYGKSIAKGEL